MTFVIGGAGYIGSHVLLLLAEHEEPVVVIDNLSTGTALSLLHGEPLKKIDLSDIDQLSAVFAQYRPDTVLHFAASIDVGESVEFPIKYYKNNTENTLNVLNCCTEFDVKHFVFSSTAAVYGLTEKKAVNEQSSTRPLSPYGWSKLMSEQMIKDTTAASGMHYVILRYFNVAGADPGCRLGQTSKKAHHLIKVCLEVAMGKRDHVDIFGSDYDTIDGSGVRDYIHVMDLATAHIDCLEYLKETRESNLFNVGYGKGYSVHQIIKTVEKVTGKAIPTHTVPRRKGDSGQTIADNTRILEKTKWKPKFDSIEKIITDAWKWQQRSDMQ